MKFICDVIIKHLLSLSVKILEQDRRRRRIQRGFSVVACAEDRDIPNLMTLMNDRHLPHARAGRDPLRAMKPRMRTLRWPVPSQ